jgi:outer membrane immunogenic protein
MLSKSLRRMKSSSWILLAFAAAGAGSAFAADIGARPIGPPPPAVPPPLPAWTGFYIGLNAGGNWFDNNSMNVVSAGTFNFPGLSPNIMNVGAAGATTNLSGTNNGGFIGGGQIGYNWRVPWGVAGIEADIQGVSGGTSFTGTTFVTADNGIPTVTNLDASKRLDWLSTVRGRIGWLTTPTLLLYGTGGFAFGAVKSDIDIIQSNVGNGNFGQTAANFSDTRSGWAAGAGFEWLFLPNWSMKVEWLHYDLGDVSFIAPQLNAIVSNAGSRVPVGGVRYGITPQVSTRFDGDIARFGVNYHFSTY